MKGDNAPCALSPFFIYIKKIEQDILYKMMFYEMFKIKIQYKIKH